ncbi:MAG: PAS domain-containing hybrid sensor histidine kinase/response regulator [Candidatus Methylomirabilia bacterium]
MEDKQTYIRRETDRILQEWSARTAVLGAGMFLSISLLDFYCVPDLAVRFLGYRIVVAACLLATAAAIRRTRRRGVILLLAFSCILISGIALEAMILNFGGHRSPYLIGLILLAVVVVGLIPSGAGFATLSLGGIFAVYVVPILLWDPDTVLEPGFFTVSSVLFFCVLASGVLIRWFHQQHLVSQISLRHDLIQSRESLEIEIAQRAQSDAELRESRELLSSVTAAAMDGIVLIDHDGAIRYWNPAATTIFGYTAKEAVGRGPFTFLAAPEKADALLADYRSWQATGANPMVGRRVVSRGRRKSGEVFPIEIAMTAVARGDAFWACALLTDISERAEHEERLSLFTAAVEGAAEGIFIVDLQGRVVYCNTAAAEQLGHTPSQVVGRNIRQMYKNPAFLEAVILPSLFATARWSGEIPGTDSDGKPLLLWLTASLVRNPEGRPIAMIGLTRDLATQKKLEAQHVRTQKLESVGVLAGGLAHDFNNLLTIILGNLDLIRLFAGPNPDVAESLDHAAEAALRAGDLTRQLITFSKGGQPVKRVGNIARVLRETVLFAAAGSNIACDLAISEDLPPVDFDEGQIRQVIHNFVQNAREAMPGGGTLKVAAGVSLLAPGEIAALLAGRYLRLEFTDHGTGIAQENLDRIFDPYFSTKEMGTVKGRGLGLAVSYSIVLNHGGTITAVSVVGEGTTIAVYLPEATRAAEDEEEPDPAPATDETAASRELMPEEPPEEPRRGRVLIMDDEPLVLEMAGAAVRRLGYAATLSRSGAEAIVQYQIGLDSGKRFDAVILDLTVPGGLGGPETVARLRQIDPEVRAALSSGYTDHPAVTDWAGSGFAGFIAKPYSLKAFEDLLAKLV